MGSTPRRIGIFGSYVKNKQDEKSDIDLVVEFDMSSFDENFTGFYDTFISLSDYLESLFGRKTDILTPVSIETYSGPQNSDNMLRYR